MVDTFKALADQTRLRILSLFLNGANEMCVCEIEKCLQLTQSNVSKHLAILRNAGILSSKKHSQWVYYEVDEAFSNDNRDLVNFLKDKVRSLPTYEADKLSIEECKKLGLCK